MCLTLRRNVVSVAQIVLCFIAHVWVIRDFGPIRQGRPTAYSNSLGCYLGIFSPAVPAGAIQASIKIVAIFARLVSEHCRLGRASPPCLRARFREVCSVNQFALSGETRPCTGLRQLFRFKRCIKRYTNARKSHNCRPVSLDALAQITVGIVETKQVAVSAERVRPSYKDGHFRLKSREILVGRVYMELPDRDFKHKAKIKSERKDQRLNGIAAHYDRKVN